MQLIPFSYDCKGNWGGDREAVLIKSFYHAVDFILLWLCKRDGREVYWPKSFCYAADSNSLMIVREILEKLTDQKAFATCSWFHFSYVFCTRDRTQALLITKLCYGADSNSLMIVRDREREGYPPWQKLLQRFSSLSALWNTDLEGRKKPLEVGVFFFYRL
jgi:hypothetical protein